MIPHVRLEIGRGDGVVAALDGVAVFVPGGHAADPILACATEAIASDGPPGRDLARRLAGLLTGDEADDVPAFGVIADTGGGLLVFLFGSVVATSTGPDGVELRLSGADAATWLDRVLPPGHRDVLVVAGDGNAAPSGGPFELTAGVVPAGWMRAVPAAESSSGTPASAPAAAAEPAPASAPTAEPAPASVPTAEPAPASVPAAEPAPASAAAAEPAPPSPAAESDLPPPVPAPPQAPAAASPPIPPPPGAGLGDEPPSATGPDDAEPPTEEMPAAFESIALTPDRDSLRQALPVEAPEAGSIAAEAAEETVPDRKIVAGIMCSRQHFNSPDSHFCSTCGISMVHATHNLVHRERPPLGFLVFDDGSTFTLDDRYVLGREPDTDPLVKQGEARPIPLEDPQMSVSRIHAEINLVGWDVHLVDRGSTNGTHVLNDEGTAWSPVTPGQPHLVAPGTRGAVGQRTFVYETPQRRV